MLRLTGRWIIPVDRPPLEWGIIEIDGERIHSIAARNSEEALNLGEVVILPGLINAHTHLEFSSLYQPLPVGDSFAEWIGRVVALRRERGLDDQAVYRGFDESLTSGVTTLAEIATSDAWQRLPAVPGIGVVFREIIGLKSERWQSALATAQAHLEDGSPSLRASNWIVGLSPHAPYSVHPRLYERLIDLAISAEAPVAIHLAETREELELLQHGRGPLVEQLLRLGAWQDGLISRGTRVLDYLMPLAQTDRGLVIHGNYLADDEIEFLARHPNLSVVYCPRTHAAFHHPLHPWLKLLEAGVNVALGTDSRASNPDLSVWSEVSHLAECFPQVDAAVLIRLATLNAAVALGLADAVGTLAPRKLANLLVLQRHESQQRIASAEADALNSKSIVGVMQRGCWVIDPTRRFSEEN